MKILFLFLLISQIFSITDCGAYSQTLEEIKGFSFGLGASEMWDAVTGTDELGDNCTTFMHKRWGTAIQLHHAQLLTFSPFRFIPNLNWITSDSIKDRASAMHMYGNELRKAEYWYAYLHLEELIALRDVPSVLPEEMQLGPWKGRRFGEAYLLQNNDVAIEQKTDKFTERRRLVLLPDGFFFMGPDGMGVTVQFDEKGALVPPAGGGIKCSLQDDCFVCYNSDLTHKMLGKALGLTPKELLEDQRLFVEGVKHYVVQQRADDPTCRIIAPHNYRLTSKGWAWCGKGTGNMLDGSKPYE